MVWWIAGAIAGLGLLVLIVAVARLVPRLRRLRRVQRSLRVRADQAQRLRLGLGPDVTAVGPVELVDRIREQAAMALDQYAAAPPVTA